MNIAHKPLVIWSGTGFAFVSASLKMKMRDAGLDDKTCHGLMVAAVENIFKWGNDRAFVVLSGIVFVFQRPGSKTVYSISLSKEHKNPDNDAVDTALIDWFEGRRRGDHL